jgi:hypothetical protein
MGRILIILASIALTACGEQYSSGSGEVSSQSDPPSLEDFQKSLQGTWERPCLYDSKVGSYYIEAMAFSGSGSSFGIVTLDKYFSDSSCSQQQYLRTQTLTVLDMQANGNDWTFTANITNQTYAPLTPQAVTSANSQGLCGIHSWTFGTTLTTTNTSCNAVGNVLDTIALINGQLYRALDELKYPDVLSGTLVQGAPYTKKH